MNLFNFTKLVVLCLVTFSFVTNAFAKGGGSSDGSGHVVKATEQDIRDATKRSLLLVLNVPYDFNMSLLDPIPPNAIEWTFGRLVPVDVQFMASQKFFITVTEFIAGDLMDKNPDPGSKIKARKNPFIYFKPTGFCESPDDKTGDGSINHVDGEIQLCLSLEYFKNVPAPYLEENLSILIAHEMTHAYGLGENRAAAAQAWFTMYLKARKELMQVSAGRGQAFDFISAFEAVLEEVKKPNAKEVLCFSKDLENQAWLADQHTTDLRLLLPQFNYPDVNTKKYWTRKIGLAKSHLCGDNSDLASYTKMIKDDEVEFENYRKQFGYTWPKELDRGEY